MVMYSLTCAHSATHSDALDLYGFLPDVPGLMRQEPPVSRNVQMSRDILATILPDQFPDAYYGSLAFAMHIYEPDDVSLF